MQVTSWQKIGLNSIWLLLGRAGSQVLMLLFTIFIARSWGNNGLGQVAFMTAVLFVGNVVSTFGMDTVLIRATARSPQIDTSLVTAALLTQLTLSVLFITGLGLLFPWLPNIANIDWTAMLIAALALLPLALATVGNAVLRGKERMDLIMGTQLATAVIQTGGAYFIVQGEPDLRLIAMWLVITQLVSAGIIFLLCQQKFSDFRFGSLPNGHSWLHLLRQAYPLAILMSLAVVYQRLGIFTLSFLADDATTGLFTAAARLIEGAKLLPYAIAGALFPVFARHNPEQANPTQLGGSVAIAFGIAFGISLLAPWLIPFLYGSGYETAVFALQIIAWSLPFFVVTLFVSTRLVAHHQGKKAVIALLITLPVTAVSCAIGWQQWQIYGVCGAIVFGESVQATILLAISNW